MVVWPLSGGSVSPQAADSARGFVRFWLMCAPIPGVGDIWEKIFMTPLLWHFHFVESPIALDLVKGRERLMLEHVWLTNGGDTKKFSEHDKC